MPGKIYHLAADQSLHPMEETPYDSESLLQAILAKYPDLLAGEQINSVDPRRWLLISREMAVQGDEPGASRWSLDHLFLDQDAVPTLVEVKKGTNTDIRRKVIGQMLDYAANAVVHWPVEEIRAKFEHRCEVVGEDPDDELSSFLEGERQVDEFWLQVKTNLQAGRIRMVFLADIIPTELRRVVEFLNEQMDPAEVLAVEVKQFVGEGQKTFVPLVIGQTETAKQKKTSSIANSVQWDEDSFMAAVEQKSGAGARRVAQEILDWLKPQVTRVWWGSGSNEGGIVFVLENNSGKHYVCRMSTRGILAFWFDRYCKYPPFNSEPLRREFLAKLNQIPGVSFSDNVLTRRARIPLQTLTNNESLKELKSVLSWLFNELR